MNRAIELSEHLAKTISDTTDHVKYLADTNPTIACNLQTIADTLEVVEQSLYTLCDGLEMERKQLVNAYESEKAHKNRAYDFILTEGLIKRFKFFRWCNPAKKYFKKTGYDIVFRHLQDGVYIISK